MPPTRRTVGGRSGSCGVDGGSRCRPEGGCEGERVAVVFICAGGERSVAVLVIDVHQARSRRDEDAALLSARTEPARMSELVKDPMDEPTVEVWPASVVRNGRCTGRATRTL